MLESDSFFRNYNGCVREITMEKIVDKYNLSVKNVHGKNEAEIYKNYIDQVTEKKIKACLKDLAIEPKIKDDTKSDEFRMRGNELLKNEPVDFGQAFCFFSKSLRYATPDSLAYVKTLSSRCSLNFYLGYYKCCLIDTERCLKMNCIKPDLRAFLLHAKACSFQFIEQDAEAYEALNDLVRLMNELPPSLAEIYTIKIEEFKKGKPSNIIPREVHIFEDKLPVIEKNTSFHSASTAVRVEYSKENGYRVLASKDIKSGEALFVEKAYAFVPYRFIETKVIDVIFEDQPSNAIYVSVNCSYCAGSLITSVPCRQCVQHLFCNETCRDSAWEEFHQWECLGDNLDLFSFNNHGHLALRILFRAVSSRAPLANISGVGNKNKSVDVDNNYRNVFNLSTNLDKINKQWLTRHCAGAAIYVEYLKEKTDFFKHVKRLPGNANKSFNELTNLIGGLIVRHCVQMHSYVLPIKSISEPRINTTGERMCRVEMTNITMCPSIAIMRHSCFPNTAHSFIDDVAIVKAIDDIKVNEEIFRSYISVLNRRTHLLFDDAMLEERKSLLKKYCFVDCKCRICSDPRSSYRLLNGYKCIKCKEGTAGRSGNGRVSCIDCKSKYFLPMEILDKEEEADELIVKNQNSHKKNIEELHEALVIIHSIHVTGHSSYTASYHELSEYHLSQGNFGQYLYCAKLHIEHVKRRTVDCMDVGISYYAYCAIGYEIFLRTYQTLSREEITEAFHMFRDLLSESMAILTFYYPRFHIYVDRMIKDLSIIETKYNEHNPIQTTP